MLKKLLGIIGVIGASALLVNSMLMTFYLKKIDSGLNENLHSVEVLGQLQKSVINKNEELNGMLGTVTQVDSGLTGAAEKTSQLLLLLKQVVDLNANTLQINRSVEQTSSESGVSIASVNQSLKALTPYTAEMKKYMEQLKQTAESDQEQMKEIKQSTERMNEKIPGGP